MKTNKIKKAIRFMPNEVYELSPINQKSFYGKAIVKKYDRGIQVLQSYQTDVVIKMPNGDLFRLWDGWSATTGKTHLSILRTQQKRIFKTSNTAIMKNFAYSILLGYLFAILFFKHCTMFAVTIFLVTLAISLVFCVYVLINFKKL